MKTFKKISLATIVCLGGFSILNANSLEENIKNIDISGGAVYNYENFGNKKFTSDADKKSKQSGENNYKLSINAKMKLDDNFKVNTRFVAGNLDDNLILNAGSQPDQQIDISMIHSNVEFVGLENTSIILGKQGIDSPFTVVNQIDGNEQTGTGFKTLYGDDFFKADVSYYNNTNIDFEPSKGEKSLLNANALIDFHNFAASASFIGIQDVLNAYTGSVNGHYHFSDGEIGAELRYAGFKYKKDDKDSSLIKANVYAEYNIVNAGFTYAVTKELYNAIEDDSETSLDGWAFNLNSKKDAKMMFAQLGVDIIEDFNTSVNYANLSYSSDSSLSSKENTLFLALVYKINKSLSTNLKYGIHNLTDVKEKGKEKNNRGTFQIAYEF